MLGLSNRTLRVILSGVGTRPRTDLASDRPRRQEERTLNFRFDSQITSEKLEQWSEAARSRRGEGKLPRYIPLLAQADPDGFAVEIHSLSDRQWSWGNATQTFPFMSAIKPFLFLYWLEALGVAATLEMVGVEPSDRPFNSGEQLQLDSGFPRNPLLNSGAIALASRLSPNDGKLGSERLRLWLNERANCTLILDEKMLASVRSRPNTINRSLAETLASAGYLYAAPSVAIDAYECLCCLSGTTRDLARLGMLLVRNNSTIQTSSRRSAIASMVACGLYEHSARFAVEVGVPAKSGVSGAIVAAIPKQGAIACYSPPLDAIGNSVAGAAFIEQVVRDLDLCLFA